MTKNDHFQAMLKSASERGCASQCVVFDDWYASLENLKTIRDFGWRWLTRLKSKCLVNPDDTGLRAVPTIATDERGMVVHLKGYGLIRLFLIVAADGRIE